MRPNWAFIMPDKWTSEQITWFKGATVDLRQDQVDRVWHLMNSWGCQPGMYARDGGAVWVRPPAL
jgi:hypothetical protein